MGYNPQDNQAKRNVRGAITSPHISAVNFKYKGRVISSLSFAVAAHLVSTKKLKVEVATTLGHNTAKYDPLGDKIYVSSPDFGANDLAEKSLIVHEVTHAILDLYGGRFGNNQCGAMKSHDDEFCGYLAQAIFQVGSIVTPTSASPIERAAIGLVKAKTIGAFKSGQPPISEAEAAPVLAAIASSTTYSGQGNLMADHNGIKGFSTACSP